MKIESLKNLVGQSTTTRRRGDLRPFRSPKIHIENAWVLNIF